MEKIEEFFENMPVFDITMGVYIILGLIAAYFLWQVIKHRKSYKLGIFVLLTIIPLGFIGGLAGYSAWQENKETKILSAVQTYVVTGLNLECVSQLDELFVAANGDDDPVWIDGGTIYAKQTTCDQVYKYINAKDRSELLGPEVFAIHALNRGIMIGTTVTDLPQAECYALQNDHLLAQSLGANLAESLALRTYYHEKMFPNVRNKYYSGQCKNGGTYAIYDMDHPLFTSPLH